MILLVCLYRVLFYLFFQNLEQGECEYFFFILFILVNLNLFYVHPKSLLI